MDQQRYEVILEEFANRHFIKNFEKKYKDKWAETLDDIMFICEHIDEALKSSRANLITADERNRLIKLDFAIRGIKVSPKKSGNRCILLVDERLSLVRILLVYAKTDLSSHNETAEWKRIVWEQYADLLKKVKFNY